AFSTTTIIVLLLKGAGLYALVAGWVVQQLAQPVVCWLRVKGSHAAALPPSLPRVGWKDARDQLLRSLWVSIGSISHVLVNASDVIVIGALLGPAAVVPYVITGKLMSVLSNVPNTIAQAASPALSDLLVRESPERLAAALSVL